MSKLTYVELCRLRCLKYAADRGAQVGGFWRMIIGYPRPSMQTASALKRSENYKTTSRLPNFHFA
jgi:hypothetical protein